MITLISYNNNNENKKIFTELAMEKVIEDNAVPIIVLIDEDNNYSGFLKKYNYYTIDLLDFDEEKIKQQIKDRPDLFLLNLKYPVGYHLKEIRQIEEIFDKTGRIPMLIYDTNNAHEASFIIDEYSKLCEN